MSNETETVATETAPRTRKPLKKVAKAVAKSAAVKETAKVATKKAPVKKAAAAKAAPAETVPSGLTKRQHKVLTALASGKELSRNELADATGMNKGWSKLLGASTHEEAGDGSLEGLGYIKSARYEGSRSVVYAITAAGKKALAAK
jgi:hypothetical protein